MEHNCLGAAGDQPWTTFAPSCLSLRQRVLCIKQNKSKGNPEDTIITLAEMGQRDIPSLIVRLRLFNREQAYARGVLAPRGRISQIRNSSTRCIQVSPACSSSMHLALIFLVCWGSAGWSVQLIGIIGMRCLSNIGESFRLSMMSHWYSSWLQLLLMLNINNLSFNGFWTWTLLHRQAPSRG